MTVCAASMWLDGCKGRESKRNRSPAASIDGRKRSIRKRRATDGRTNDRGDRRGPAGPHYSLGCGAIVEDVSSGRLEEALAWIRENGTSTNVSQAATLEDALCQASLIIDAV